MKFIEELEQRWNKFWNSQADEIMGGYQHVEKSVALSEVRDELTRFVEVACRQFDIKHDGVFVESAVGAINGDLNYLRNLTKEDAGNIRNLGFNQGLITAQAILVSLISDE